MKKLIEVCTVPVQISFQWCHSFDRKRRRYEMVPSQKAIGLEKLASGCANEHFWISNMCFLLPLAIARWNRDLHNCSSCRDRNSWYKLGYNFEVRGVDLWIFRITWSLYVYRKGTFSRDWGQFHHQVFVQSVERIPVHPMIWRLYTLG